MLKDPVCGKTSSQPASRDYDYRGEHYEFCSEGCRRAFVREPEQFLIASTFNYHEIDPLDRFLKKVVHQVDPEIYAFLTYRPREKTVRLILDKNGKCRSTRFPKEFIDRAKWDANSFEQLQNRIQKLSKRVH